MRQHSFLSLLKVKLRKLEWFFGFILLFNPFKSFQSFLFNQWLGSRCSLTDHHAVKQLFVIEALVLQTSWLAEVVERFRRLFQGVEAWWRELKKITPWPDDLIRNCPRHQGHFKAVPHFCSPCWLLPAARRRCGSFVLRGFVAQLDSGEMSKEDEEKSKTFRYYKKV